MEHDKQNKEIWFDYDNIWSKLESLFYIDYEDIQLIMKDWLEEHYNLSGITPLAFNGSAWWSFRSITI
jgi:hypothetical protein